MPTATAGEFIEDYKEKELGDSISFSNWKCEKKEIGDGVPAIQCVIEEDGDIINQVVMTRTKIEVDSQRGILDLERSPQAVIKEI